MYGQTVALWKTGSEGTRVGALHRVKQTLEDGHVVTECGLLRGIWNRHLTSENTLAVPVNGEPTCRRCALHGVEDVEDGTSGQDRKSYTDTQDRKSYSVEEEN